MTFSIIEKKNKQIKDMKHLCLHTLKKSKWNLEIYLESGVILYSKLRTISQYIKQSYTFEGSCD